MGSPEVLPAPPALADIARDAPVSLFLDFDGTLVDIADRPELIEVPDYLAKRLLRLTDALDGRLAIVSGRSIADLHRHIADIPIAFAGSHGLEVRLSDGTLASRSGGRVSDEVFEELRGLVARNEGLSLETKSLGAAIHYRAAPQLQDEVVIAATTLADHHGLAIKRGKCVVEILPHGGSKASAVRAFMQRDPFAGSVPVFVGDDVTDEDGFVAAREHAGFGIAVGERNSRAARYRLASPAAVRAWCGL